MGIVWLPSCLTSSGNSENLVYSPVCPCTATVVCSAVSNSFQHHELCCQAPLPMEFSRQEYWIGLPFPSPGDLSDSGIEPASLPPCHLRSPCTIDIYFFLWGLTASGVFYSPGSILTFLFSDSTHLSMILILSYDSLGYWAPVPCIPDPQIPLSIYPSLEEMGIKKRN